MILRSDSKVYIPTHFFISSLSFVI